MPVASTRAVYLSSAAERAASAISLRVWYSVCCSIDDSCFRFSSCPDMSFRAATRVADPSTLIGANGGDNGESTQRTLVGDGWVARILDKYRQPNIGAMRAMPPNSHCNAKTDVGGVWKF